MVDMTHPVDAARIIDSLVVDLFEWADAVAAGSAPEIALSSTYLLSGLDEVREEVARHRREAMLDLTQRGRHPTTRADLARFLGLTPQAVTNALKRR